MVITEGCHVDNGSQGGIHFDNLTFNVLDNLTFNVQNIEFYIDNLLVAGSPVAAGRQFCAWRGRRQVLDLLSDFDWTKMSAQP